MASAGGSEAGFADRLKRSMRRASFILPKTGERSKRQFTLRNASSRSSPYNEASPLLGNDGAAAPWSGDDETPTQVGIFKAKCRRQALRARHFLTSRTGKAILKCSIAYLLGSLATFVPAISGLFGHRQDSKHLVATVTVYFHPARSIGSMHEATILAAVAVAYSAAIAFTSMGLSMLFEINDLLPLGHILILVVFVGGGLGLIAWTKQKLGNPLVNVACSLAALGCITILIKEGSVQAGVFSHDTVVQILCMVIMGVVIATVVNFLLFPVLARQRLSKDMQRTTDLLGEMLICITRAFLRGQENDLQGEFYKKLSQDHQSALDSMKKNLGEAKKEFMIIGKEGLYDVEARLVACLDGLSQDLGGLRSAAFAQFSFINQVRPEGNQQLRQSSGTTSPGTIQERSQTHLQNLNAISEDPQEVDDLPNGKFSPEVYSGLKRFQDFPSALRTDTESSDPTTSRRTTEAPSPESTEQVQALNIVKSPGDMFLAFISRLGPPAKSLVYTMKQILDELPFNEVPDRPNKWNPWVHETVEVAVSEQLRTSLGLAIEMYRQSRKEALEGLYQNRAINTTINAQQGSKSKFGQRNFSSASTPDERRQNTSSPFYRKHDEVLADIEEVSACCGHFSFSLLDFAEDVMAYLEILDDLKSEMTAQTHSWTWLLFWNRRAKDRDPRIKPSATRTVGEDNEEGDLSIPFQLQKADRYADVSHVQRPWYYCIHKALRVFRRDDVVFATKVGIGAIIYALPAFRKETRPFFVHWRGEWGLVTYMLVCCMTIGASNVTGFNRLTGTLIGSCLAVLAWVVSNNHGQANPWLLGFLGWLVSLPCFYINIAKNDGPFCRFILLTYNLGALYSYSLSVHDDDNDDDEGGIDPAIWDIVLHRFVSVVVGIIWGMIVSRVVWPMSARRKLTKGLSVLWLRMGLIFKRDPLVSLLLGAPSSNYMDIREEAELHSFLGLLKSLRKAAVSEFELRGPFPDEIFGRILNRTGRMLDAFHAMNVVIRKNLQYTPGEAAVLRYTRVERVYLSARICHLLTVLASSIKLEYPINDALPDIENSRDKLLARISEYRRTDPEKQLTTEQDYELLYAYVLITGQLAQDIQAIVPEVELLYGTLNEENLKLE